jgi:uncharacterized protein
MTPELIRILAYMDYATEVRGCGTVCKSTAMDKELWFVLVNNRRGIKPLVEEGYRGSVERLAMLLRHGARINAVDSEGYTALKMAVIGKNLAAVRFLCERGADVSGTLELTCFQTEPQIAYLLYSFGARGRDINGLTVLMGAIVAGHDVMISQLLSSGVDVNEPTRSGRTALMYAAGRGQVELVLALLTAGARRYVHDNFGGTAATAAEMKGHRVIVKLLST